MPVTGFDHIALPTADAERFIAFYTGLGFGTLGEDEWRAGRRLLFSLTFGDNKINVHPPGLRAAMAGRPEYIVGLTAEPGCGDVCFVWAGGIDALVALLQERDIPRVTGPVGRQGGRGNDDVGVSVYIRDPDGNLVEFISYDADDVARHAP